MFNELAANISRATLTGLLLWVKEELSVEGCREIGIRCSDETAPLDSKGRIPLRGIKLTKSMTQKFDAALGEVIFKGRSVLEVTVRTEDLHADLEKGHGLNGVKLDYFLGDGITIL